MAASEGGGGKAGGESKLGAHGPVDLRGWCHGPPGAFLARALALQSQGPEPLLVQEKQALALTLEASPLGEPSLCCGSIGRNEILLVGAQLKGKEVLMQRARQQAELFCRWNLGERLGASSGLFSGSEGFLFHLCRLLAPHHVGSVLVGEVSGDPGQCH